MAVAFALIIVGFLVKAAAVPFHFWLADAHAVAPTPVCMLFSGAMVELGAYAVARVYWSAFDGAFSPHAAALRPILIWVGALTALVGSLMCIQQRHLKRLLAFSTVGHVGLFLICLGVLTRAGVAGLAGYVIAHGFAKAALFVCVGILIHRFAEVDELRLHGRGRRRDLALVGAAFAAAGLALTGVPMLGVFLGKSLGEDAAADSGFGWAIAVFVICSALTAGAVLRAAGSIFAGWGEEEPPASEQPQEVDEEFETLQPHDRTPLTMVVTAVVLAIAALGAGSWPELHTLLQKAGSAAIDHQAYLAAVLHGTGHYQPPVPEGLRATDFVFGAVSASLAIGVAATALFGRELVDAAPARLRSVGGAAMVSLRRLHSGHVGEYVAWFTAGLAAFAALFALALR